MFDLLSAVPPGFVRRVSFRVWGNGGSTVLFRNGVSGSHGRPPVRHRSAGNIRAAPPGDVTDEHRRSVPHTQFGVLLGDRHPGSHRRPGSDIQVFNFRSFTHRYTLPPLHLEEAFCPESGDGGALARGPAPAGSGHHRSRCRRTGSGPRQRLHQPLRLRRRARSRRPGKRDHRVRRPQVPVPRPGTRGDDAAAALDRVSSALAGSRIARLITEILSPGILVAALLLLVAAHASDTITQALTWGLIAAGAASFLPLVYLIRGVRRGRWTDKHVTVHAQRRHGASAADTCCACLVQRLAPHSRVHTRPRLRGTAAGGVLPDRRPALWQGRRQATATSM